MSKILIVDDERLNLVLLKQVIKKFDNENIEEVDEALNGQIGLEKFIKENHDLIITDMQMPVMDGVKFMEEVRKINCCIPIFLHTAFEEKYVKYLENDGIRYEDEFLHKPLDFDKLEALIC